MSGWKWLATTKRLQEDYFRRELPIRDPDDLADYLVMNHTALVVELSEFMAEIGWKDWATPRGWVNREEAIGELIDVGHFLANMLCALDVTDDEWETRYQNKQEINRQRQRDGYDGVTGKCLLCHRSFDDEGVTCVPGSCNYRRVISS